MKEDKSKRLTIIYYSFLNYKNEKFKNVSDPDSLISKKDASNIKEVFYGGKPYDISNHRKLYSKVTLN